MRGRVSKPRPRCWNLACISPRFRKELAREPGMLPFKGPFYLAQQTGAPIIPVSIFGTETMMRKGSLKIYPGVAHIHLHPAIYAADFSTREDLIHAVRESIAGGLPEWMRG